MTPPPEQFAQSEVLLPSPLDDSLVASPLRAVAQQETWAAERRAGASPVLTWLLDGLGWGWLRAAADATALLTVVTIEIVDSRSGVELLALVPLAMLLFWLRGAYRRRISSSLLRGGFSAAGALATATIALALWNSYVVGRPLEESVLLRTWALCFVAVVGARAMLLGIRHRARLLGLVATTTLIVGSGKIGVQIAERLLSRRGYGLNPVGFLERGGSSRLITPRDMSLPVLGDPEEVEQVARATRARHVVISFARDRDQELVPLIRRCSELGLEVSLVPRLFESINERLTRDSVGPLPLHVMQPTNPRSWEFACKHVIDRTVAALALLLLAPLFALVAIAIKLTSRGPVLFRQSRVGRDGNVFEMLKFRSMLVADPVPWLGLGMGLAPGGVEGEDRRTSVGRFLRQTSIDELPQLWNVLRGEMSLVGPRPERPEYVDQFRGQVMRYDDRHRVKSGITGAAQVNGLRGKTGLADRIEWDNYYIENWTLGLDFKILAHTVLAVLRPVE